MQTEYVKAISNLEGVDGQVIESMRKFMAHTFDTATKGYTQRPEWVNKITRVLSAYEFTSKLGFGVTTALRNLFSGGYYLAHMGTKYNKYLNDYKIELNKGDKELVSEVVGELGFTFLDASQTADELALEGVLPAKGVRKDSLYYDTGTGDWKYEQDGTWKKVDGAINYVANKSAVFQRVTENALRDRMFQSSFMRSLEVLRAQSRYSENLTKRDLYRKAGKIALQAVNKFAFDYSIQNKARIIGGTHKDAGAIGQALGIFMHYPMAFANLQAKAFKGGYDAIKAGQGMSNTDVQLSMAFTGMYLLTGLMSGLTNMDLAFWINNDTAERINNIFDYITAEDDKERDKITYGQGVTSLFTGPGLSTTKSAFNSLIHTAVATDFINMPDNELLNFMTGYDKYADLTKDDKLKFHLRQINNQGFKLWNKTIPAFQSGRPGKAFVSEFHLYPNEKSQSIRDGINKTTKTIAGKSYLDSGTQSNKEKIAEELRALL
jgi:hypothetical protein